MGAIDAEHTTQAEECLDEATGLIMQAREVSDPEHKMLLLQEAQVWSNVGVGHAVNDLWYALKEAESVDTP